MDKWLSERIQVELQNTEVCAATVHKTGLPYSYIVCAVYRPPSSDVNTFYEELAKLLPNVITNISFLQVTLMLISQMRQNTECCSILTPYLLLISKM